MKKIVYYVASSIDGFISGKDGDISGFVASGNGVQHYLDDLKRFETVIMGKHTYEFGYQYGLKPGLPAYPHMDHYIFSKTISLDEADPKVNVVRTYDLAEIERIQKQSKTDVYLCGGGVFAAWLLKNEKIDVLKLKINPLILGQGVRLFGGSQKNFALDLEKSEQYDEGMLINTYSIKY